MPAWSFWRNWRARTRVSSKKFRKWSTPLAMLGLVIFAQFFLSNHFDWIRSSNPELTLATLFSFPNRNRGCSHAGLCVQKNRLRRSNSRSGRRVEDRREQAVVAPVLLYWPLNWIQCVNTAFCTDFQSWLLTKFKVLFMIFCFCKNFNSMAITIRESRRPSAISLYLVTH